MLDSLRGLGKLVDDRKIDPKIDKFFRDKSREFTIEGLEHSDIYQELCMAWWRALPRYDPSKSSEYRYAHVIASSTIRDLNRHSKRQKRGSGVHPISIDELVEKEVL